jgi:hypothetical protein
MPALNESCRRRHLFIANGKTGIYPEQGRSLLSFFMRSPRMLFVRACKSLIPVLAIASILVVPASATRTHRAPTASHSKRAKKKPVSHQIHGQRQIDPDRAREIQTALIREHYLSGEPTGQWDSASQAAMSKFQADQGWQTKLTPDSRALIKLGLGPSQDSPGSIVPANPASSPVASVNTQPSLGLATESYGKDAASQ